MFTIQVQENLILHNALLIVTVLKVSISTNSNAKDHAIKSSLMLPEMNVLMNANHHKSSTQFQKIRRSVLKNVHNSFILNYKKVNVKIDVEEVSMNGKLVD